MFEKARQLGYGQLAEGRRSLESLKGKSVRVT